MTESHNDGHEQVKRRNILLSNLPICPRFFIDFYFFGIFRRESGALIYPKLKRSKDVPTQDLRSKMEFSVSNIYQNLRAQGTLSDCLADLDEKDFGSETFDNSVKTYSLNSWAK